MTTQPHDQPEPVDHAAESRSWLARSLEALDAASTATIWPEHDRQLRLADIAVRTADVHAQLDATEVQRGRLEVDRDTLATLRSEHVQVVVPAGDATEETAAAVADAMARRDPGRAADSQTEATSLSDRVARGRYRP